LGPTGWACRGDPQRVQGTGKGRAPSEKIKERKMPKMKTKSGAKKRFKFSATGKIKHGQAFKRHRLISKSKRARTELKGNLSESETRRVKRWMPYA
jgi:large subunit ribosomal protein L35